MRPFNELINGIAVENSDTDGFSGIIRRPVLLRKARIVCSWGLDWEHVSVSWPSRTPTWKEMCAVKRHFWLSNEVVVQYHPAEGEYINCHPYCLHLWRPTTGNLPMPPSFMIGPKGNS